MRARQFRGVQQRMLVLHLSFISWLFHTATDKLDGDVGSVRQCGFGMLMAGSGSVAVGPVSGGGYPRPKGRAVWDPGGVIESRPPVDRPPVNRMVLNGR